MQLSEDQMLEYVLHESVKGLIEALADPVEEPLDGDAPFAPE